MITVREAFLKFRSRLELTQGEERDASRRQNNIRSEMDKRFDIERDFLTGSYARHTKTKPLRDVDIFCVLGDGEKDYRKQHPSILLGDVAAALTDTYGRDNIHQEERCVTVMFPSVVVGTEDESTGDQVVSFDVVPAFAIGRNYEIPSRTGHWIQTNPEKHAELAIKKNESFGKQWKFLVRMVKKWNAFHGKPVPSSFLLEVMALDIVCGDFGGEYQREIKAFFASAANRVFETWNDPAGVGEPLTQGWTDQQRQEAKDALWQANNLMAEGMRLDRDGKRGEALRFWRTQVFGPIFPLS
jgi:predicted nucleotidyltransferase